MYKAESSNTNLALCQLLHQLKIRQHIADHQRHTRDFIASDDQAEYIQSESFSEGSLHNNRYPGTPLDIKIDTPDTKDL